MKKILATLISILIVVTTTTVSADSNKVTVTTLAEAQQALDSAEEGTIIEFASGTYDGVLYLRNNGSEANRILKDVTIKAAERGAVNIKQFAYEMINNKYLDIENLTIDGFTFNDVNKTAVWFDYNTENSLRVNGLTVQYCTKVGDNSKAGSSEPYENHTFIGCYYDAQTFTSAYGGNPSLEVGYHNIVVDHNIITNVYCPITFPNGDTKDGLTITNNTFTGCNDNIIQISGSNNKGNFIIKDNTINNIFGRFARISGVAADSTFTITGNVVVEPNVYDLGDSHCGTDGDGTIFKIDGKTGFSVDDQNNSWTIKGYESAGVYWKAYGTVAQIGNNNYKTLNDAINDIPANNAEAVTIKLVSNDVLATKTISIPEGKKVILDLNGKTISGINKNANPYALLTNKGELTIIDSSENKEGKITSCTTVQTNGTDGHYTVYNKGTLYLKEGTIEETSESVGGGSNLKWPLRNEASANQEVNFTMTGGYIIGEYNAISDYVYDNSSMCNITISGGTVETNGRFSPITMEIASATKPNCNITISGGEFVTKNIRNSNTNDNATVYCDDWPTSVTDASNISIKISGGLFNTFNTGMVVQFDDFDNSVVLPTKYITGGILKVAINEKEIADGYVCVALDSQDAKDKVYTDKSYSYKIGYETKTNNTINIQTDNDVPTSFNNESSLDEAVNNILEVNKEKELNNEETSVSNIEINNTNGVEAEIDDTVIVKANSNPDNNIIAKPGFEIVEDKSIPGKTTYAAKGKDIGEGAVGESSKGVKETEQINGKLNGTASTQMTSTAKSVMDTNANSQLGEIVVEMVNNIEDNEDLDVNQGTATRALNNVGADIDSASSFQVSIYVETYYETEVVEDKISTNDEFTLDIKPMFEIYASNSNDRDLAMNSNSFDYSLPGKDIWSVKLVAATEVECSGKTITLDVLLPVGFAKLTDSVYIDHKTTNGTKTYKATLVQKEDGIHAIFNNPDGFSEFRFYIKNPAPYRAPKTGVE